DAVAAGAGA
ncbi:hypothetical protein MKD33_19835, partial [Chromobacterium piscinae]